MNQLPFDQIVHVGAGKAFAKLASGRPRPRRRRDERRLQQSTPAPLAVGQFSHIQVVSQAVDTKPSAENASPEPVFRNSSLMQDADSETEPSTFRVTLKSPVSLANNTQGATFAAKARAAELQAARARKELKSFPSSSSLSTSHEVMTFKTKSKSGRNTWKPLNLEDLPGPSGDGGELFETQHQDSDLNLSNLTSKNASSENLQGFDGTVVYTTSSADAIKESTRPEPQREASTISIGSVQPTSRQSLSNTDDRQQTSSAQNLTTSVDSRPGPNPILGTTLSHSWDSVPVLPGRSPNSQMEAEYLQQKQHTQLAELRMQHGIMTPSPFQFDQGGPSTNVGGRESRGTSITQGSNSAENGFVIRNQQSQHSFPFAYSQPAHIPPLKQKPPHHYPAVKGTMNTGFKFPPPGLPISSNAHYQPQQPHNEVRPALRIATGGFAHSLSSANSFGANIQSKDNSAADAPPLREPPGLERASRTVLHDPFASAQPQRRVSTPTENITKQDLYASSEELPWKERLVPVMTPSVLPTAQSHIHNFPVYEGFLMTPQGAIPLPERTAFNALEEEERFDPCQMEAMRQYTKDARASNPDDNLARFHEDRRALGEANFSDEASTNSFGESADRANALRELEAETKFKEERREGVLDLFLPILASLKQDMDTRDYFNRWGPAPEWCVDHGPDGNKSFFGGDWGKPPQRVGRDPRYAYRSPVGAGNEGGMLVGAVGTGIPGGSSGMNGHLGSNMNSGYSTGGVSLTTSMSGAVGSNALGVIGSNRNGVNGSNDIGAIGLSSSRTLSRIPVAIGQGTNSGMSGNTGSNVTNYGQRPDYGNTTPQQNGQYLNTLGQNGLYYSQWSKAHGSVYEPYRGH